jgi:glycerol-3-phosphate dehydrogenase
MRLPDGRLARPVPQLNLSDDDIIATYAGVRPVIDSGKADPSKETRDHALWLENGLLTVTGGKLTTFRVIALDASSWPQRAARARRCKARWSPQPVFAASPPLRYMPELPPAGARLQGRYGAAAQALAMPRMKANWHASPARKPSGPSYAGPRAEDVCKLEDLLLRRTRIGIQLRGGGIDILPRIRSICQPELGWSDQRWAAEQRLPGPVGRTLQPK